MSGVWPGIRSRTTFLYDRRDPKITGISGADFDLNGESAVPSAAAV